LPRPRASEYEYSIAAVPGADTPALPQGLFVLPGKYEVRLTVGEKTWKQPLVIGADPRAAVPPGALEEQMAFYREVVRTLETATDARTEIEAAIEKARATAVDEAKKLERFVEGASPDNVAAVGSALGGLATDLESADAAPTKPQREYAAVQTRKLEAALESWRRERAKD
jgi:hypothetical protein